MVLFVKTDLLHNTAVYLSVLDGCDEVDCTEGAMTQLFFDFEIFQLVA